MGNQILQGEDQERLTCRMNRHWTVEELGRGISDKRNCLWNALGQEGSGVIEHPTGIRPHMNKTDFQETLSIVATFWVKIILDLTKLSNRYMGKIEPFYTPKDSAVFLPMVLFGWLMLGKVGWKLKIKDKDSRTKLEYKEKKPQGDNFLGG